MNLTTKIETNNKELSFSHKNKVLMLGSCFTDNIGERLKRGGFDVTVNPFGALYNPQSIINALTRCDAEFLRWTQKQAENIDFTERIDSADIIILTLGTAWVYELKESGHVVANCRKQPDSLFTRRRLTAEEIIGQFTDFIEETVVKHNKQLIFTVSPIRHKKDGLHENQLSKSILLLAIDQLCRQHKDHCHYFPSYEIMMDELRDYRFYADDMLHPSAIAIEYIWERFQETYFKKHTMEFISQFEALNRTLQHHPYDAESETYRELMDATNEKLKTLRHAVQNQ